MSQTPHTSGAPLLEELLADALAAVGPTYQELRSLRQFLQRILQPGASRHLTSLECAAASSALATAETLCREAYHQELTEGRKVARVTYSRASAPPARRGGGASAAE